jgi:hypothetical protein
MEGTKAVSDPLLGIMCEANKRASALLSSTQAITAKLVGSSPTEKTLEPQSEICLVNLAHELHRTLSDLESELSRQHNILGPQAPQGASSTPMMGAGAQSRY